MGGPRCKNYTVFNKKGIVKRLNSGRPFRMTVDGPLKHLKVKVGGHLKVPTFIDLDRPFKIWLLKMICISIKTVQSSNADGAKEQIGSFAGKYARYVREATGKNMTALLKVIRIW